MSLFIQQTTAFLSALDVEHTIEPPLVHFTQRRLSFHLVELKPCTDPLFFQTLSMQYEAEGRQVVHVWEDQWNNKQTLVQARIRAMLGDSRRIFARNTTVQRIDKPTLDNFLQQHHLQGSTQAKYKYGLYHKEALVAVASFSGKLRVQREGVALDSYELVRFATLSGCTVTGGLSKLLAVFRGEIQPGDIMSYADRDWSCGRSYEKLGFAFIENTPPQAFLIHPHELQRLYPHRLPNGCTEEELLGKGYFKIHNAGNKKYIWRLRD